MIVCEYNLTGWKPLGTIHTYIYVCVCMYIRPRWPYVNKNLCKGADEPRGARYGQLSCVCTPKYLRDIYRANDSVLQAKMRVGKGDAYKNKCTAQRRYDDEKTIKMATNGRRRRQRRSGEKTRTTKQKRYTKSKTKHTQTKQRGVQNGQNEESSNESYETIEPCTMTDRWMRRRVK